MQHRVGRFTLAIALIILGVVLVIDTTLQTEIKFFAGRLWPGLLILLGLEWLAASARNQASGSPVRVDGAAIAMLVIVAIVASAAGSRWPSFLRHWRTVQAVPPYPDGTPSPLDVWHPSTSPRTAVNPLRGPASEEVTQTQEHDADKLESLTVQSSAAEVRVEPGEKLRVEMRVRGYGFDQQDALRNARQVQLRVERPTPGSARIWAETGSAASASRLEIAFRVEVPAGVAVRVESASGPVTVTGRKGPVAVQSASGAIAVDAGTRVDLRSASGSIQVANVEGEAVLATSSGSIEAGQMSGSLKATSTSGSITARNAHGPVTLETTSGRISLETDQVGGEYSLSSISGSIDLALPANAGVTVTARSTSGTVSGPPWLTIGERRGSGTGVTGDGRHRVNVRSTSGAIRIDVR